MAVDSRAEQRVRPVLAVFGVLLAGIVAGILAKESDNWSSWTRYLTSYGGSGSSLSPCSAPPRPGCAPLPFLALWASAGSRWVPGLRGDRRHPARRPVEPR